MDNKKITIIGAGSWGCALASLLKDNGHDILLYDNNIDIVDAINKYHTSIKIPGSFLDESILASTDLNKAVNFSDIILTVVPTKVVRSVLKSIAKEISSEKLFINAAKGIEAITNKRISEIVSEEIPSKYLKGFVSLTGPSHAEEVINKKLTLVTSACEDISLAKYVQEIFSNKDYFRVYTSDDLVGAEVCGALKNVYAIASGFCEGMGFGVNARAALITRSLAEIRRLAVFMGAKESTLLGLTGVGDMIVTCTSKLSRNYQAGLMIANGENLKEALSKITMVVEGANTCIAAFDIATKNNIYMPIVSAVYNVIYKMNDPKIEIAKLMGSDLQSENF